MATPWTAERFAKLLEDFKNLTDEELLLKAKELNGLQHFTRQMYVACNIEMRRRGIEE